MLTTGATAGATTAIRTADALSALLLRTNDIENRQSQNERNNENNDQILHVSHL